MTGSRSRRSGGSAPQTLQIQRTSTSVFVDQRQSTELVKVIVVGALSMITSVRKVFPDECFECCMWNPDSLDASYRDFVDGNESSKVKPSQTLLSWPILQRTGHRAANKLLDWLEIGVADALSKKFLASLQLSFYDGQVEPDNVLEAYTINITYKEGEAVLQMNTEIQGSRDAGEKVTLFSAKEAVRNLVCDAVQRTYILGKPGLPENAVMSMHLTYTEACLKTSPDYNPPGFKDTQNEKLITSESGDNQKGETANTGFHSVEISVFSKHLDSQYSSRTEGDGTQESKVEAFNGIGARRRPSIGTQDTQAIVEQPTVERAESLIRNEDLRHAPYTQDVMDLIEEARQENRALLTSLNPERDTLAEPGCQVSCECEASLPASSEQNLVQCDVCQKFKHAECYGYLTSEVPALLVCYSCLPGFDTERKLEMSQLCVLRRALYYIRSKGGLRNSDELRKYLRGCGASVAENHIQHLLKDNYLKPADIKHGKGKRKSNKSQANTFAPMYTYVNDEERLRLQYFHPEKGVAEYFAISSGSKDVALEMRPSESLRPVNSPLLSNSSTHSIPRDSATTPAADTFSSTQGTPGPWAATRRSSYGNNRGYETPLKERFNGIGSRKKRLAGIQVESEYVKRPRGGEASTPTEIPRWGFRRRDS